MQELCVVSAVSPLLGTGPPSKETTHGKYVLNLYSKRKYMPPPIVGSIWAQGEPEVIFQ